MLKICAGVWCLMGAVVIVYIASSGAGGRTVHPAPDWLYKHY